MPNQTISYLINLPGFYHDYHLSFLLLLKIEIKLPYTYILVYMRQQRFYVSLKVQSFQKKSLNLRNNSLLLPCTFIYFFLFISYYSRLIFRLEISTQFISFSFFTSYYYYSRLIFIRISTLFFSFFFTGCCYYSRLIFIRNIYFVYFFFL